MKKLSKMIIIALGLVLLASGIASAKIDLIATKAPITSTSK
jgi:outer membrane murein-binding lipoprotein Lpp